MIEKIHILGFKSLARIELDFKKFNCFVGMNGAGKSSILQALDFLSQQMQGDISGWLENRGWDAKDLIYKGGGPPANKSGTIIIGVLYRLDDGSLLSWAGSFSRSKLNMVKETASLSRVNQDIVKLLESSSSGYELSGVPYTSTFNYQGSILSQLKEDLLPPPLVEFRQSLANMQSLELLSPNLMRKSSRAQDRHIGIGGEKLSGFLDTLRGDAKIRLLEMLKKFYPSVMDFRIITAKGGWKRLIISEQRTNGDVESTTAVETGAAHLNDGLLRILAILAQIEAKNFNILLLDEIEDGINPEIVERLVDELVNTPVQIIVTTHSPMILNYLSDEVARNSVQFVYKRPNGQTGVRRFFSIPRIDQKLDVMGPGEAFVDTSLPQLANECIDLDMKEAETQ